MRSPRDYQIAVLAGLLAYGIFSLDFPVSPAQVLVTLGVANLVQWAGSRWIDGRRFDPKSAVITALSLCLLLRTGNPAWAGLAAAIAIGSKFLLRARGKHVFNPANFALIVLAAGSDAVWLSPGQWGETALAAFALACLGTVVVTRAARADVTGAFLAAYAAGLFGRAWWLGDPFAIAWHHMGSGALLLFAFFMISDPRTTPQVSLHRVGFGTVVAAVALILQFEFYWNSGVLWALVFCCPLVPILDAHPNVGLRSVTLPLSILSGRAFGARRVPVAYHS